VEKKQYQSNGSLQKRKPVSYFETVKQMSSQHTTLQDESQVREQVEISALPSSQKPVVEPDH
jgi:hypothetical protein